MHAHPLLDRCPLYEGLSPQDKAYALAFFDAKTKSYEKGEFLHSVSFPLQRFGLVLSGIVQVYMDDIDGHHIIMNHVEPGDLSESPMHFWASTPPSTSVPSPKQ